MRGGSGHETSTSNSEDSDENDEIHFISTPFIVNLNAHLHIMLTP